MSIPSEIMTHPPRTGLVMFPPSEVTNLGRALWAEERGFDSVWFADGGGKMHALTAAGGIAAQTRRIRIGLGVVPVYTHTPAVLAAATLALTQLAPGRIVMGLGSSSKNMMAGWHGIPFEKPLTRVKETTSVLRAMLRGENVRFEGETLSSNGFRLNPPLQEQVPIYLAALRPKMLELAGEIADGVILHLAPLRAIPRMLEHIAIGAARSGRSLADLEIALRINTYVTKDPTRAREQFRQFAAVYYSTTVYNKFLVWCGFEKEAARIADGFREGDRSKIMAAMGDSVCEELGAIGPAEKCMEEAEAFRVAGINTIIIHAATTDPEEAGHTLAAFAPENTP